jgi:hypothetical protein
MDFNYTLGKAQELWDLWSTAMVCLIQQVIGVEMECPPCWKCTTLRYLMAAVILVGAWLILGYMFWGAVTAVLICLVLLGKGRWERLRVYLKNSRQK